MAFQLPTNRTESRRIQPIKRTVPLEQIIAVEGQNPLATGVEAVGTSIGGALQKRAELIKQGQQIAQIANMAGEQAPTDNSLTPDIYEKGLTLKNARLSKISDAAKARTELEMKLEGLRSGHTETDPISGLTKTYPGVQGMSIAYDGSGNPYVKREDSYKPKLEPLKKTGGGGVGGEDKEWGKLVDTVNPQKASSRSTLGIASQGNLKADRAIVTLNKPTVTKAELGNVMADVASIYQGGAPTDTGMSHQDWSTAFGKVMGNLQFLTGNPQDAVPEPIKQRILTDLNDLKAINQRSISNNLNYYEKARSGLVGRHKAEWLAARQEVEGSPSQGGLQPLPVPGAANQGGAKKIGRFSVTVH